jgi:hypothetical protein
MPASPQHVADAYAVVGGPERALGKEDDRPAVSFVDAGRLTTHAREVLGYDPKFSWRGRA